MRRGLRYEKGFSLIEVMIAAAIAGIVMPMVAMTTVALFHRHEQVTESNVVLRQAQNAGYWISQDVRMAKNVSLGETNGFPLVLDVPLGTDSSNNHSIHYILEDSSLKRRLYDSSDTLISEILIAKYIDMEDTTFTSLSPRHYVLVVKACLGEVTLEVEYRTSQRLTPG